MGRSEELLGIFSTEGCTKDKKVSFATKLAPFPWRVGKESFIKAHDASSERMKRNVDILQLHWRPPLGWQEKSYLDAFGELCQEGKVTQLGVSNYGPKTLSKVDDYVQVKYGCNIASNQVQFSLLSRYPLETGLIEVCQERGTQLIAYSPLGLGLLTDKYSLEKGNLPPGPRGILFREYLPHIAPLLGELRSVAKQHKKSVAQVALNWPIQKGALVLVGMRDIAQANDNIGALGWSLTAAEVEAIDCAAQSCKKQLIQNNFQSA
jgi:pyridoxine 4-dehydrogenase